MPPQRARVDDSILTCVKQALTQTDLRVLAAPLVWESLSAQDARRIVDALKEAADRHWRIDPRRSVDLAEVIIAIGEACDDTWIRALGTMAKGDAIKFIGSQQQAWDLLEEASRLFKLSGDEVGWGRTWIGRLSVAVQLGRVHEAIEQAKITHDIFVRHGERLRQLRIEMALGNVYSWQGDHRAALASYQRALDTAASLGEQGEHELCVIHNSIGVDLLESGELREALQAFVRAHDLATRHGERVIQVISRCNSGVTLSRQGYLRAALKILSEQQADEDGSLPLDVRIQIERIECLLALNRFVEARDACLRAREGLPDMQAHFTAARLALHLATAQAYLNDLASARASLVEAENLFAHSGAKGLIMLARLRQAQIALLQDQWDVALSDATLSADFFSAEQQYHNHAEALLVQAQAFASMGDRDHSRLVARTAARIAQERGLSALRYGSHAVLGRVAELEGDSVRALRHYKAAVSVVRRLRRELMLTLRPNFMLDKLQPLRSVFRLHIQRRELADAFVAVEQERAQTIQGYLTGREQLRWSHTDDHSRCLIEELNQLREMHYDLYTRVHDAFADAPAAERAGWETQLAHVERRMRSITEQLYLRAPPGSNTMSIESLSLTDIRACLDEDHLLVSYYNDGARFHALSLDRHTLEHHPLELDFGKLSKWLGQLDRNIARALIHPDVSADLRPLAIQILVQLYRALVQPLCHRMHGRTRVFIVPHGLLHFLPFNLLSDGQRFLIERYELVTLPGAGLLARRSQAACSGALALANDYRGQLTNTNAELAALSALFDARCCAGQDATRAQLQTEPRQILHIAAHGEHRPDNPDFSYIELADGQLFTDDLLQLDLGYELVTLSACETGRARVAPDGEVMGLGWAFLYAGAGAVISSLWRVDDSNTAALMQHLYASLKRGASKASAMRSAQQTMMHERPDLHPANWGAFQLIGNPERLSSV